MHDLVVLRAERAEVGLGRLHVADTVIAPRGVARGAEARSPSSVRMFVLGLGVGALAEVRVADVPVGSIR